MTVDTRGMIEFLAVLTIGVGGAIGARAIGDEVLSMAILSFAAGLLVPTSKLLKRNVNA
jgi:hypothetical protein